MADLIEELKKNGPQFGFFQAICLLEEYFRKKNSDSAPLKSGRIRFAANPSISFPPGDIASVEQNRETVRLLLSFMGLLGVSSPLPNYFSDYAVRYPENAAALSDFCAMFNHRMYVLFFEAFRKYRFPMAARSDAFLEKLALLAGQQKRGGNYRLCAYTGMLSSRRRSARALEVMLSDFFGAIPVRVMPWIARRVALPNPTALDGRSALGINTMAGTAMVDITGKFRVAVGPLRRELFETFLENSANHDAMRTLIQSFITDPLAFDIEVTLAPSDLIPVVLGETAARLGQTSSLGRSAQGRQGDAYSVILPGAD